MPKESSIKPAGLSLPSVPAFWPMAMAMTMFEGGATFYAKNLKFVEEEVKIHDELRPILATSNQVRLDLRTMVLRDYGSRAEFRRSSTRPMLATRLLSPIITMVRAWCKPSWPTALVTWR